MSAVFFVGARMFYKPLSGAEDTESSVWSSHSPVILQPKSAVLWQKEATLENDITRKGGRPLERGQDYGRVAEANYVISPFCPRQTRKSVRIIVPFVLTAGVS